MSDYVAIRRSRERVLAAPFGIIQHCARGFGSRTDDPLPCRCGTLGSDCCERSEVTQRRRSAVVSTGAHGGDQRNNGAKSRTQAAQYARSVEVGVATRQRLRINASQDLTGGSLLRIGREFLRFATLNRALRSSIQCEQVGRRASCSSEP